MYIGIPTRMNGTEQLKSEQLRLDGASSSSVNTLAAGWVLSLVEENGGAARRDVVGGVVVGEERHHHAGTGTTRMHRGTWPSRFRIAACPISCGGSGGEIDQRVLVS